MLQSGKDYGVRFKRPWGDFGPGDIIKPMGLLRSHLIDRNIAEEVKPEDAQKSPASAEPKKKAAPRRAE